ncbi:MAG: rod shape determining protein RodA [Pseudomonadota bacterium]|nr:rod shape determining protein RodA [Pseudomonadota bacterium]
MATNNSRNSLSSRLKQVAQAFCNLDKIIIAALLALAVINILVQYSANDKVLGRLISDSIYLAISFVLLIIMANISLNQLKHWATTFYIITIIFLVVIFLFGVSAHGAKRWLFIGVRIQPSELCKLSVPIMLACYYSAKNSVPKWKDYISGLGLILIPFLLIAKQPDLGTGILVLASGLFVLFFVGLQWRVIIIGSIVLALSTPIIWHFLHDYQQHRILTLINPQSDPLGAGYHIIQGIIAIGSGGFYGKGYLQGTQIHLDFIPEKHTDFVISVLAEEFGYLGVCVVLLLYLILIIRSLMIMKQAHDLFAQVLAGSITMSFTLYVLINMGMVSGLLPVVGVPLPFISYGGTATVVLMLQFGILLSIARENKY